MAKYRFVNRTAFVLIASLALVACGAGEEKKPAAKADGKPETYLTPETAGPDYAIQGEYVREFATKDDVNSTHAVAGRVRSW